MRNPQNLIRPYGFQLLPDGGCRLKGQYSRKSGSKSLFGYHLLMNLASVGVVRLHSEEERVVARKRKVSWATHIATELDVVAWVAASTQCCGGKQTGIDAQIASQED